MCCRTLLKQTPLVLWLIEILLFTGRPAFANPCNDYLAPNPAAGARGAIVELDRTHPAIRILEKYKKQFIENHGSSELIDPRRLLNFIEEMNSKLSGKFQAFPYSGQIHFFYIEGKTVYSLEKFLSDGKFTLTSRLPSVPAMLRPGSQLSERFQRLSGHFLVGFERAWNGLIIPLFSKSNRLTEFRDMSAYESSLFVDPASHEALPRFALEVPLFPIRQAKPLFTNQESFEDLPHDLRALLSNGHTLSTISSLKALSEEFVSTDLFLKYNAYSVLIVADDDGQGRTGVLLRNGTPLIVVKNGVEYFLEIKGVGLATLAPIEQFVHARLAGHIRIGRASESQVLREFEGYKISKDRGLTENEEDLPIPVFGVALPEYAAREVKYISSDVRSNRDGDELSGQVFRLSPSTRRMAYTDNSAYGSKYKNQPELLAKAQEYYGEIFAKLRIVEPGSSYMHHSPHPQNFVVFRGPERFALTDFSDIHSKNDPYEYLEVNLPDIDQYGVFKNIDSRNAFLKGIRNVLEPKGLWTSKIQSLVGTRFSEKTLIDTLTSEYLYYFLLKYGDSHLIQKLLIPKIREAPFHFMAIIEEDRHAIANRSDYLEIAFRHYVRDISLVSKRVKLIASSSGVQREFQLFSSEMSRVHRQLERLISRVKKFYTAENSVTLFWRKNTEEYARVLLAFMNEQARIYDSIESFRLVDQKTNVAMLHEKIAGQISPNSAAVDRGVQPQ